MLGSRRARGDDTLYARAKPQKVELTETYSVTQEISRNPSIQQNGDGTGRIEISVPYDGREYFTRQAVADVERVIGPRRGGDDRQATIGHLLLAEQTNTSDLPDVMRSHNQAGLIPISVPVATRDGSLDLTQDRHACVIAYDYRPANPPIYPIDLTVEVDDQDSLSDPFATVRNRVIGNSENPSEVLEKLRQAAGFSSQLEVTFLVRIAIPVKDDYPDLEEVVVTNMSLQWPTLTSISSTELYLENLGPDRAKTPRHKASVRYNPDDSRLEWQDVPMTLRKEPGSKDGRRIYKSAKAYLKIGHPGELFSEDKFLVKAEVEIPRYLMSGLEARLFDATGRRHPTQPSQTTHLSLSTDIYPADIFASRTFSPYQQFVFDDIIPEEIRITDITNVLRAAKFSVKGPFSLNSGDPLAPLWLLQAERSQGPDELVLLILVEGRRTTLGREEILADNRTRLQGDKQSGQLKVSVVGRLPRNHRELTREMNSFQQALRERYSFHQMSRK